MDSAIKTCRERASRAAAWAERFQPLTQPYADLSAQLAALRERIQRISNAIDAKVGHA